MNKIEFKKYMLEKRPFLVEEQREAYYGFSCLILFLWLVFIGIAYIWHWY